MGTLQGCCHGFRVNSVETTGLPVNLEGYQGIIWSVLISNGKCQK